MPTKYILRAGLDIVLEMSWRLVSAWSNGDDVVEILEAWLVQYEIAE